VRERRIRKSLGCLRARVRRILAVTLAGAGFLLTSVAHPAEISIGYQRVYDPWMQAIATGQFERSTGYEIEWRAFDSSIDVMGALARGEIQIGHTGGTGLAGAASVGADFRIFWILHDIGAAEALVVREGSDIVAPQGLRRKRIAVPAGSTAHYQLLFALEQFDIRRSDVILTFRDPKEILEDWKAARIDAAFVWGPVLAEISRSGTTLVNSGHLRSWGRPTFAALAVDPEWAAHNPRFMTDFVGVLAATDNAYRRNPAAWDHKSGEMTNIARIVGGTPAQAVASMRLYNYPSMREQVTRKWLGGGSIGGVAKALLDNAVYLRENGQLRTIRSDYAGFVTTDWITRRLAGRIKRR